MSPLRERVLCDFLVGIECFSCSFDNVQRSTQTDKYTEWLPRFHVLILLGPYESQYLCLFFLSDGRSGSHTRLHQGIMLLTTDVAPYIPIVVAIILGSPILSGRADPTPNPFAVL